MNVAKEVATQLNWLDVGVIIIALRIIYIGTRRGLAVEFFKLIGVVSATYISIHYFSKISDWIVRNSPIPVQFSDFICFLGLVLISLGVWLAIREVFLHFVKIEAVNLINKWGGGIFGMLRVFLLLSLFILILEFSSLQYIRDIVKTSLTGVPLSKIAPRVYTAMQESMMMKLFPKEELNEAVYEIMDEVER